MQEIGGFRSARARASRTLPRPGAGCCASSFVIPACSGPRAVDRVRVRAGQCGCCRGRRLRWRHDVVLRPLRAGAGPHPGAVARGPGRRRTPVVQAPGPRRLVVTRWGSRRTATAPGTRWSRPSTGSGCARRSTYGSWTASRTTACPSEYLDPPPLVERGAGAAPLSTGECPRPQGPARALPSKLSDCQTPGHGHRYSSSLVSARKLTAHSPSWSP